MGKKITLDGNTIEFVEEKPGNGKWIVKHNGQDKGSAMKVKLTLTVTSSDGIPYILKPTSGTPGPFLIYQNSPTCFTYWDGQSWNRYCY